MYDDGIGGKGTDWYCTEFDIQVQTKINFNYLSLVAPDLIVGGQPVTDNAAQIMSVIRSRLLKPRRDFSVTCNGVELIPRPMTGNEGTVDAQNGPMPQFCSITQLTTNLFLVTYHIIAKYWENNEIDLSALTSNDSIIVNQPGNNVLYNRWTESQSIDEANFSSRTRTGKMMIRSDNAEGKVADQCRTQMAIVGLPSRFVRQSSHYQVSSDGLAITYRIVDLQKFKLPPPPAYKATGSYSESSALAQGNIRYGEVNVTLEGGPDTDQDVLADAAMAIATQKVRNRGATVNAQGQLSLSVIDSSSISVGMYDNWVTVSMRVKFLVPDGKRQDGISGMFWTIIKEAFAAGPGRLCATPLSDNLNTSPRYNPRGAIQGPDFLLQAAAYYDPSLVNARVDPQAGQLRGTPFAPGQAGKNREV